MADQRKSNQRRPTQSRSSRQQSGRRSASQRSRRKTRSSGFDWSKLLSFRRKAEFRPDAESSGLLKVLHLTHVQRDSLLKWGLYITVIVVLLTIQDVIMSQISIFDATTDLVACVILLITVIEGVDVGSIFVLIASSLYYFSGSSPGPYSIALLTFLGIGACLFRQVYWHRNHASIVLCAGLALMLYEIGTFAVGFFSELTRLDRFHSFLIAGGLSVAVMIPLYSLIHMIGQIGGNTWKE